MAASKRSFILSLDSEEDTGLYIDRLHSHLAAHVEIIDDGESISGDERPVQIRGLVSQRHAMPAVSFSASQDSSVCH